MKKGSCKGAAAIFGLRLTAMAFALVSAVGCAASSVEGNFADLEVTIVDPGALLRVDGRGNQIHVMISEESTSTVTTALLRLPTSAVAAGEQFSFGDDDHSAETAHLQMSRGSLVVTEQGGSRVTYSMNPVISESVSGTVVLQQVDETFAGTFHAVLEDGGEVDGQFTI